MSKRFLNLHVRLKPLASSRFKHFARFLVYVVFSLVHCKVVEIKWEREISWDLLMKCITKSCISLTGPILFMTNSRAVLLWMTSPVSALVWSISMGMNLNVTKSNWRISFLIQMLRDRLFENFRDSWITFLDSEHDSDGLLGGKIENIRCADIHPNDTKWNFRWPWKIHENGI